MVAKPTKCTVEEFVKGKIVAEAGDKTYPATNKQKLTRLKLREYII